MTEHDRPLGSLPPIVPDDSLASHNALTKLTEDIPKSLTKADVEESEVTAARTGGGHRGLPELGLPVAIPDEVGAPLSDGPDVDEPPRLPEDGEASFPSNILGPTAALGILALLSLILLFVYDHVLGIINVLAALPAVPRYTGYLGLAALGSVIVAFALRLVYLWARLRRTPAVRLSWLKKLSERRSLREMASRDKAAAQKTLLDYLEQYPATGSSHEKLLARLGTQEDEILRLYKARRRLLDPTIGLGPSDWLDQFQNKFVAILDEIARRSVKRRAFLVGVKTAAAPNPAVDMLVATYGAFVITGDVCRIYNVRAGAVGTLVIMAHAFANIFFAGRLEEATQSAADEVFSEAATLGARVFGKVLGKVTEGAANGVLMYRLGTSVMKYVQPIRR